MRAYLTKRPRLSMLVLLFVSAALIVSSSLVCSGTAVSYDSTQVCETPESQTDISLWVYPIGDFGDPDTVQGFIAAFNQEHPGIHVTVEYLDYAHGDDQINAAIAAGTTPDIVMEGPERIVSGWGAKGLMADVSDLWTDEATADISVDGDLVADACRGADGACYEYPLCKTAHCMAINYELFEKAGALQYLDLENRTWTTEGFQKACQAIADSGLVSTPGVIYCGGQGGDQGTRALVSNLYGARFTNDTHTLYTIDSAEGVKALATLKDMTDNGSLSYDINIQASDELKLFAEGSTAMTFAWNSSNEAQYASDVDFTPYAMAFPTDQPTPSLCSGIWGFGVFDNGSAERIAASKELVSFLCDDPSQGPKSVRASRMFPVRASFSDVYAGSDDEQRMGEYAQLMRYANDYYNITPGWAAQRTVWWNMLQAVFTGTEPQVAAEWYTSIANGAIDHTVEKPVASIAEQSDKHVLFISSYSVEDPTVTEQVKGIQSGLDNNVYLHTEFMDSVMVNDATYVSSFYRYISDKYERFDGLGAIIVGDDDALQMVLRYQKGFFRNIPVIYESVNSSTISELADSLGMVGVQMSDTTTDNLDLACKLYPHATRILAISDESAQGSAQTTRLKAVASRYAPMTVEVLDTSACTPDQIANRIEAAGDDTILLYLSFTNDANGKVYPYREALDMVTDHAQVPVFTQMWLGGGTLGGIATDATESGRRAGQIANSFLVGDTPDTTQAAQEKVPAHGSFDVSVMDRFGLARANFPADATFYNDTSAQRRTVALIIALAVGVAILAVVLVLLGRINRRRKHHEQKLQETSEILRAEAEIDELTGLGNRRSFDREMERSTQAGRPFTLLLLDVDDFKNINDGYGHLVGDLVLREIGTRMLHLRRRFFVPYRYGGDEFAIMVFTDDKDATADAESKLLDMLHREIETEKGKLNIDVCVGSSLFPYDADNPAALIICADKALYAAKAGGKHTTRRYKDLRS